jgi:mannose-6-phosphate isomerase-like protein (cupin superfamily)
MKSFAQFGVLLCGALLLQAAAANANAQQPAPAAGSAAAAAAATIKEPPTNIETNTDIDRFIGIPSNALTRIARDVIMTRSILTQGDPQKPGKAGAVLRYRKDVSLNLLMPGEATPLSPVIERQLLYIESGEGRLDDGVKMWDLHEGLVVLIPAGLVHRIGSTGTKPLQFLNMSWTPATAADPSYKQEILVRDVSKELYVEQGAHGVNLSKGPFNDIGERFLIVYMGPKTVAGLHSHTPETEEGWVKITEGDTWMQLGNELRPWPANVGMIAPTSGQTVHAAINTTDSVQSWFYFASDGVQRAPRAQTAAPTVLESATGNPTARSYNPQWINDSLAKSTVPGRPLPK